MRKGAHIKSTHRALASRNSFHWSPIDKPMTGDQEEKDGEWRARRKVFRTRGPDSQKPQDERGLGTLKN